MPKLIVSPIDKGFLFYGYYSCSGTDSDLLIDFTLDSIMTGDLNLYLTELHAQTDDATNVNNTYVSLYLDKDYNSEFPDNTITVLDDKVIYPVKLTGIGNTATARYTRDIVPLYIGHKIGLTEHRISVYLSMTTIEWLYRVRIRGYGVYENLDKYLTNQIL